MSLASALAEGRAHKADESGPIAVCGVQRGEVLCTFLGDRVFFATSSVRLCVRSRTLHLRKDVGEPKPDQGGGLDSARAQPWGVAGFTPLGWVAEGPA